MKLDPVKIRYLTSEEFRVLTAVENGSRNHEVVPLGLIATIAGLRGGGSHKVLSELLRKRLVDREANTHYEGFRMTYGGYDYLALKTLAKREVLYSVGNQIGVGKESDVYIVAGENDLQYVLKIHRLGRTSFRTVKKNRDYLRHRKHASWLYLSRLSAMKEFAFMKVLYDNGFPVPRPIDVNRHCVVMELLDAFPMVQVQEVGNPGQLYSDLMDLIVRLAQHGLIHGDYNEFNIMITQDEKPILIDFPQMISTSHPNAEWYFNRDIECIRTFFKKRFGYESLLYPKFTVHGKKEFDLDVQVAASGFTKKHQQEFDELLKEREKEESENEGESEEDSEDGQDNEGDEGSDVEEVTGSIKAFNIKDSKTAKFEKILGEAEEDEEGEEGEEEEEEGSEDGGEGTGDEEEEEEDEEDQEDGELENNNRSYRPFRNSKLPPPSALQTKKEGPKKSHQPLTEEEIRKKVKLNLERRAKSHGKSPNKVKSREAKKTNDHINRGKSEAFWL